MCSRNTIRIVKIDYHKIQLSCASCASAQQCKIAKLQVAFSRIASGAQLLPRCLIPTSLRHKCVQQHEHCLQQFDLSSSIPTRFLLSATDAASRFAVPCSAHRPPDAFTTAVPQRVASNRFLREHCKLILSNFTIEKRTRCYTELQIAQRVATQLAPNTVVQQCPHSQDPALHVPAPPMLTYLLKKAGHHWTCVFGKRRDAPDVQVPPTLPVWTGWPLASSTVSPAKQPKVVQPTHSVPGMNSWFPLVVC